jgi:hypothetical protein
MDTVDIVVVWTEPDDTPLSFVFQFLLKPPIYRAEYITDINSAYERCIRQIPNIIIIKRRVLDDNDGFALCRQFRADDRLRSVPIIIGWLDAAPNFYPQSAIEAQAHGANGCFGRVYNIEGIQNMILQLLKDPTIVGLHDQDRSWESLQGK